MATTAATLALHFLDPFVGVWNTEGATRFSSSFRDGGRVFAGTWELRSDEQSNWRPWMDVMLTKAK